MRLGVRLIGGALLVLTCCGCGDFRFAGDASTGSSQGEASRGDSSDGDSSDGKLVSAAENGAGPVDGIGSAVEPQQGASEAGTDKAGARQSRLQQRFGELFASVLPILDQTRELVDRHASLPDSTRVPFKPDKQSNSAAINELLDEAIVVLNLSEVTDYRQQIRDATDAIAQGHANIADYRRQRVSAAWAKDQSHLDKVNPFELSKEAIDQSIADEQTAIENQEQRLVKLKQRFSRELAAIGVEVDEEGVESLLSSVSGDDIVSMAVVFDNIKQVTSQLQQLTEESGEALDVSKRYYGMYVVMIHVMDRIQKSFVRDVDEKHIPKLRQFAEQADRNIAQAKSLIEIDGGDRELLQANIASNELTRETASLYIEYLKRNAELISAENKRAQKNLATAMNTYDTVKLSSDVAALMNTGRRDFEALMKLQIPTLREFNNEAIRKEFKRMTSELRSEG